jgi:hypothetical protein
VSRHEALGEVLGPFQLRGGARRAEDAQPDVLESVDEPSTSGASGPTTVN